MTVKQIITIIVCHCAVICQVNAVERSEIFLPISAPSFSSVLVGDLDNNLHNGLEYAVASSNGELVLVGSDHLVRWTAVIARQSCIGSTNNRVHSSVTLGRSAVGNILIVGTGGVGSKGCDGGVQAFKVTDGTLAWNFSTKKWAKKKKHWLNMFSVFSTVLSSDLDGDNIDEVFFGSFDRHFYSLSSSNGIVNWYYQAADTVWASPALVSNQKNAHQLIVATDISKNTKITPATPDGGYMYRMRHVAKRGTLFRFREKSLSSWRSQFDQVLTSSPAVGELLPDNPGLEIAIGTGCYFKAKGTAKRGNWIKVISATTGAVLRTLESSSCSNASPAIGDIDGDLLNDVVSLAKDDSGSTVIEAWNPRTGVRP